MNNYEKIKNMSLEDMAKTLYRKYVKEISHIFFHNTHISLDDINFDRLGSHFFYEWLKQECE